MVNSGAPNGRRPESGSYRVLLVDPDRKRALSTALALRRSHRRASIELAETGGEAIRRIATEPPPEAVVISLELPDVNGLEVVDRIRRGDLPKIRTVVLAAAGAERGDVGGREIWCDAYFVESDPAERGTMAAFALHLLGS